MKAVAELVSRSVLLATSRVDSDEGEAARKQLAASSASAVSTLKRLSSRHSDIAAAGLVAAGAGFAETGQPSQAMKALRSASKRTAKLSESYRAGVLLAAATRDEGTLAAVMPSLMAAASMLMLRSRAGALEEQHADAKPDGLVFGPVAAAELRATSAAASLARSAAAGHELSES